MSVSRPSWQPGARGRSDDRRGRGERGAATVELAICLPVLLIFLLGIVSSGLLMNHKIQLSHAAREAARYGATVPVTQSFTGGTWAETVRSVAVERSAGDLTTAEVCVALVQGKVPTVYNGNGAYSTNGTSPCISDDGVEDPGVRVQVTVAGSGRIETGMWSRDVTFELTATAKHEELGA